MAQSQATAFLGGNDTVVVKDPDLWFDDGSVVIVAQETGFRVHKSLLSRVSPIFRDLFMVPQPVNDPSFEGAPLLHVSESPHDMRCLLRAAIYDEKRYLSDMAPLIPFAVLSALMRLGHKYELPGIVDEAEEHLRSHFTTKFEAWIHRPSLFLSTGTATFTWSQDGPHADVIETVNLARLTGRHAILPLALYSCCVADFHATLHGRIRSTGEAVRLCPEDVVRCVYARERLLKASGALVLPFLAVLAQSPSCQCTQPFSTHMVHLRGQYIKKFPDLLTPGVLDTAAISAKLGRLEAWKAICSSCHTSLLETLEGTQRKTWADLLDILDLDADELGIEWL